MRYLRSLCLAAGTAALLASCLDAQVSAVAPRIAGPVDETALTALRGNVTPLARADFDRGEAAPATQMGQAYLVLSRSAQQQAALDKLMAEQLDKSSPNYRHWLTPQEFDSQFGVADSDLAAIRAWLESHGLRVNSALTNHTSVAFTGSVSQFEEAFHTPIHSFQGHGQVYLSNTSEPRIPTALRSVVAGVAHLNTFRPTPQNVPGPSGMLDPQTHRPTRDQGESMLVRPELTSGGSFLYVVPADAATIYNTPNKYNANFTGSTSYTGKGVTIGIDGESAVKTQTVVNFRSTFLNGDTTAPTITDINNSAVANGATTEAYLDLELSGGLAPGATIHFYTADASAGGIFGAAQQAITDNTVDIFSVSFGLCEKFLTNSDNTQIAQLWQQAASQGITVLVSSGDSAAAGCDNDNSPNPASYGLQINGLASTPYNLAVGGTDYDVLQSGFSTYVNTSQGSAPYYGTAKAYIPEATWNNSVVANGLLSADKASTPANIVGGSGGVSACTNNTTTVDTQGNVTPGTCSGGYAKPSWQRGPGVPNDGARDIPDVSLLAANGAYGATWLICDDQTNSNNVALDCSTANGVPFDGSGGTSTSAPAMAGILALVQEKMGGGGQLHRLGLTAAKTLYDLYNGPHAADVFHDVTKGNISVPCTQGTPNCAQNTAGNYFLTGYDTTAGYDLATGLGTVNATNLITYWGAASGSNTATVSVTSSASNVTPADSFTISIAVSGSNGTPTGTVTVSSGSYSSSSLPLDANGKASVLIDAGALPIATDTITIKYSGDSNYAAASGTTQVTVSNSKATPTVTVTPAHTSISADQSLDVTVTVSGSSVTATGTVTLTWNTDVAPPATLYAGSATITIPAEMLRVGTDTIKATYNGDTNYNTASGSANVTVTAPLLPPAVAVTPASTSIGEDQSDSVTVKVSGTGATPTGKVTLSGGGYTSAATSLDATGTAMITIPGNAITTSGSVTLTASYAGDGVYTMGTGSAIITVNPPYVVTVPTQPPAVSAGGSSDVSVSFKSDGTYNGTVAVSCSLTAQPSGAQSLPGCSISSGSSLTFNGTTSTGTATVHITTSAAANSLATSASLKHNGLPAWAGATGGSALAMLVFFGIPARRRSWRNLLGVLVVLAALGSFSGCGGGSSAATTPTGTGTPATTSGTYTFTVTGTGNPAITPAPTASITFKVN